MIEDFDAGMLWMILGLLLLAAELIAPGVFLVFIGAAALATGIFTWLFDLAITFQLALFALYTALAVYIGKRVYAQPGVDESDGTLNEWATRLVGRKVTAVGDFSHGEGRVRLGDSEWSAHGEGDVKAGEPLEVIGVDGTRLVVAKPKALPPTA